MRLRVWSGRCRDALAIFYTWGIHLFLAEILNNGWVEHEVPKGKIYHANMNKCIIHFCFEKFNCQYMIFTVRWAAGKSLSCRDACFCVNIAMQKLLELGESWYPKLLGDKGWVGAMTLDTEHFEHIRASLTLGAAWTTLVLFLSFSLALWLTKGCSLIFSVFQAH